MSRISSKLSLISWTFFDWSSSSYASLIQTFIFSSYFIKQVAADEIGGSALWGATLGIAGVLIAFGSPLLGAIADLKGHKKAWVFFFYLICLISTAGLWFVKPDSSYVFLGLVLVSIGTIGSEFAFIFYNAMLADLVPRNKIGYWSGIGWGMGYLGGMTCLSVAFLAFMNHDKSWWLLNEQEAEPIRATFLLAAAWYGVFAIPFFLFTKNSKNKQIPMLESIYLGINQLKDSWQQIHRYKHLVYFLLGRMLYIDGLTTLFLFGGVYAAGTFQMTAREILLFGIVLNISAGFGAFLFASLDDRIGSRTVIIISLLSLIFTTSIILLTQSIKIFWIVGILLGAFVGPIQASSRAFMAKVTPKEKMNQMFGLFAFSGKATGFLGPFFISAITYWTESQRWGMSVLIPFFVCGLLLIFKIPSEQNFERV